MTTAQKVQRLRRYRSGQDALRKQFGWQCHARSPTVTKVVVNMVSARPPGTAQLINRGGQRFGAITGRSRKSPGAQVHRADSKLREGMPVGVRVTLRGDRMWEFLDRLVDRTATHPLP